MMVLLASAENRRSWALVFVLFFLGSQVGARRLDIGESLAKVQSIREQPECPIGDRTGFLTPALSQDVFFRRLISDPSLQHFEPRVLSDDPWIVVFDSFFNRGECEAIIQDGYDWAPDILAGGDFAQSYRNSSSFSCSDGPEVPCTGLPGIENYRRRMASALEVDLVHTEGLSVLQYQEGGFYKRHHDYVMPDQEPNCHNNAGPRILTFLAYLTDVDAGGATRFAHLDIDVSPKAGRVLLFADTLPSDPLAKDERTAHEALVVERGTKVVATTWIRQFEAARNMYNSCCEGGDD